MTKPNINPIELRDRMSSDPSFYRSMCNVEASGSIVRYADVKGAWQENGFVVMDPAWLKCIGLLKSDVRPMRSWRELCRGSAKTWGLACRASWALEFSPRRIKINWYSGDVDQSRLGINAIQTHIEANPWHSLSVQRNVVRNNRTGSELEILSSDAATGYGALCDAIVVDEIGNFKEVEGSQKLWNMILSTVAKRRNCVLEVITNPGRVDGFAWGIREPIRESAATENSNWFFENVQERPSWITEDQLNEQKRLLPPSVYARLWDNCWTAGTDTGLSAADVEACCTLAGPQQSRTCNYDLYIGACDLGWRHDRTGLIVLAVNTRQGEIALAHAESWLPQDHGGELPLDVVERELEWVHRRFALDQLVFDPREATGLSQRLCDRGLPCARINLAPAVQNDMAKILLGCFNQRNIRLYRHSELIRDLLSMEVVDRTVGLKLQAARTSNGHSDLGFAFAIALYSVWNYSPAQQAEEVLFA